MIYVIDKSLKKLPYISTAKAGSFTATFGKTCVFNCKYIIFTHNNVII